MTDLKEISTIHNVRLESYFTSVPNASFEDTNISWAAKGLLAYIITRPHNWKIHTWQLAKIYTGESRGNGLEAVKTMIKELKDAGYIVYTKSHNESGQWVHRYDVYSMPIEQIKKMFPQLVQTPLVQPPQVKPSITTKNELTKNELSSVCVNAPPDPILPPIPKSCKETKGTVCVESSLVAPPPLVEKITKILFSGQTLTLSKQDLYEVAVQQRKDWTQTEIEEVWKILLNYSQPMRDWIKFVDGTIIKKRKFKKINELKLCQDPKQINNEPLNLPPSLTKKETSEPTSKERVRVFFKDLPNAWKSSINT